MTPDDMKVMLVYIKDQRTSGTPFDVVRGGTTPEDNPAQARAIVGPWIEAAMSWWIGNGYRQR
jgi:hypothetical protein